MGNCWSYTKKDNSGHVMDDLHEVAGADHERLPRSQGLSSLSKYLTDDQQSSHFDMESVKHALGESVEYEEYDDDDDSEIDDDEKARLSPHVKANGNISRGGMTHAMSAPVSHVPVDASSGVPYAPHPHAFKKQASGKAFPKFKKPLSAIPTHLTAEGFSRAKHNSTSSLYINTTLSKPDTDEVVRCMGHAVLYHIDRAMASPHKTFFEIFDENKFPITKAPVDTKHMPNSDEIYQFISTIFKAERLDPECAIMCLAYIERIISLTGITMDPSNWRRVVLSALILASKVWEDQSVWNVDFLPVFDNLTAADLNKLERQFLALLQYNVSLNASLYAKYYFELRTFSKLDPQNFPLQPLDKLNAMRLESHSQASELRVRTFKRSASVDQLKPLEPHTPLVLS
eukprot:TRINITY_DN2809_c0_g1_i3.p1 TRINITY_DN2809_c0_g1~~TRINITY_DN2809_c0_g1_i3.p1  ORF type:complete len:400 (+),score=102.33 TRINITY_DN2809_c0_g1_i3:254-1453(+)